MKILGLTDAEVAESKAKYGDNSMTEQKGETFLQKLWGNFQDPMIRILCFALIVNVVLCALGQADWFEPIGITAAILIATLVSTYSEYNNENAFQKLQEEASRIMCKVYRNGEIVEVAINDLVVGDCILLQSGDKIPADGLLIAQRVQGVQGRGGLLRQRRDGSDGCRRQLGLRQNRKRVAG